METPEKYAHIRGWGADLDHANRPAYPRERKPPRLQGVHWTQPEQQKQHMEILRSIEHPGITPIFGTSVAPSGLSGRLRRFAFKYSENDLRHWLMLLLADRINMGEGLVADLSRGHVPNIYAEMGGPAEIRHNPAGAAKKALVLTASLGLGWWLLTRDRHPRSRNRSRSQQRRLRSAMEKDR
ncbi:MAG: hypothetical protein JWQ03_108 [Variovorax sp.]|nr:hypothetical protein [Variovorax sp.]